MKATILFAKTQRGSRGCLPLKHQATVAQDKPRLRPRRRDEADGRLMTDVITAVLIYWTFLYHFENRSFTALPDSGVTGRCNKNTQCASSEWITTDVLLGRVCPARPSSDMVISLPPRWRKKNKAVEMAKRSRSGEGLPQ